MKKHFRIALETGCLLALVLTFLFTALAERRAAADAVRADTLRLHILANSDTVEDQLLKLKARDAVLAELEPLLQNAQSKAQAQALVRAALPRLCRAARRAAGQPAAARIEVSKFPPRDYGSFALPGGEYTALRIELGQARGHNWFCVLYPALCIGGAAAEYPTAAENALVFGDYRVRFALWDFLTEKQERGCS